MNVKDFIEILRGIASTPTFYLKGGYGQPNRTIEEYKYNYYRHKGNPPYDESNVGKRGYDCIGLIKGILWGATATAYPVYNIGGIPDITDEALLNYLTYVVPAEQAQPGYVLWRDGHVGIYLGDDVWCDASPSGGGVSIRTTPHFHPYFTYAGRLPWITYDDEYSGSSSTGHGGGPKPGPEVGNALIEVKYSNVRGDFIADGLIKEVVVPVTTNDLEPTTASYTYDSPYLPNGWVYGGDVRQILSQANFETLAVQAGYHTEVHGVGCMRLDDVFITVGQTDSDGWHEFSRLLHIETIIKYDDDSLGRTCEVYLNGARTRSGHFLTFPFRTDTPLTSFQHYVFMTDAYDRFTGWGFYKVGYHGTSTVMGVEDWIRDRNGIASPVYLDDGYNYFLRGHSYDSSNRTMCISAMVHKFFTSFNINNTANVDNTFVTEYPINHTRFSVRLMEGIGKLGMYPGTPNSVIPLHGLPTGIDFTRTLFLYDESSESENAMFLKHFVGQTPYVQINYSTPTGTVRLFSTETVSGIGTNNGNFTHFVGSTNFKDNTPLVFRVTGYTTVARDIIDYHFEIDYVKTLYAYVGITDSNSPTLIRTTDGTTWSGDTNLSMKYIQDNAIYSGKVVEKQPITVGNIGINTATTSIIQSSYVALSLQNGDVVAISYYDYLHRLTNAILTNTTDPAEPSIRYYGANISSQIRGAYIIPNLTIEDAWYGWEPLTNNTYPFEQGYDENNVPLNFIPVTFENPAFKWLPALTQEGAYPKYTTYFRTVINQVEDLYHNFADKDSEYILFVPYYGNVSFPQFALDKIVEDHIILNLVIDPLNGGIALDFGQLGGLSDWSQLPTLPIPTNPGTAQQMNVFSKSTQGEMISKGVQTGGSLLALGGKAIAGAMAGGGATGASTALASTGGIGLAAVAVFGGISLINTARSSSAQKDAIMANSVAMYRGGGGTASLCTSQITLAVFTPELAYPLEDLYDRIGYPMNCKWSDIGAITGHTYWVTYDVPIKIPKYIADGFRSQSTLGIVYNY